MTKGYQKMPIRKPLRNLQTSLEAFVFMLDIVVQLAAQKRIAEF